MTALQSLESGRQAHARGAWVQAYDSLSEADGARPLGAADLELLATAAYMLGREREYLTVLGRAHDSHRDEGERRRALRCAFWVGLNHARRGEMGRANGWLGRARNLLAEDGDPVEHGYLRLPVMFEHEARGDWAAAATEAAAARDAGLRHGDRDLTALAGHENGHILVMLGEVAAGLALLDEAMVAASAGELSPIVTGIVYCGVILACQEVEEVRRAREWTAALTQWCERQPEMVAFTGRCLVHRAEIIQLEGDWPEALEEARRAAARCLEGGNAPAAGEACYRQGEVHRLRGDQDAAAAAYREASQHGREPQPGLALLRLAQGDAGAAAAAIARALDETAEPGRRAHLLAASVEIGLATGDLDEARRAGDELEDLAQGSTSDALDAKAALAAGAVRLAAGDAKGALPWLRRASSAWRELAAPYELARARELVGLACRSLGDEDSATLELEAARTAFGEVGAAPDVARVEAVVAGRGPGERHGLSERELEVLRLVAAGHSNREIAGVLVISEHTVARHLQNIYAKLGVSSRSQAGAFAFRHGLI